MPRVGWPVRVARLLAMVLVLLAGVGVALSQPLLSLSGRARVTRAWFRCLLAASGVRLVTTGGPLLSANRGTANRGTTAQGTANRGAAGRGTLVVANHVSWLDIPAVLAVEGMRVLAKSDVRGGRCSDRWRPAAVPCSSTGAACGACRRRSPTSRPRCEPARACSPSPRAAPGADAHQGRFYPALFQAAIDADAAIRPVSLRYRLTDGTPTTVAAFVGADDLVASVLRVVATRGLVVELDAGPIADAHGAARRSMATSTADLIRLSARRSSYPSHHPVGV